MGPLGWQEMVVIFFVALILFGPKKLPELGRTIGKAMTEFRRASNELKATFDREMRTLEQETEIKELKEAVNSYQYDNYNYDYSSYEGSNHEGNTYEASNYEYSSEPTESPVSNPSTEGASAPQGAESHTVVASGDAAAVPESNGHTPEHTVARGGFGGHDEPEKHPAAPAEATEHKA
jgi:sec-independent protein translocase protein TatA